MTGFLAKKGHRLSGLDGTSHHFPGCAVDAAWKINGDDRRALGIHSFDQRSGRSFDRSVEPGPEKRINYGIRLGKPAQFGLFDRGGPLSRGERSITPEARGSSHKHHPNLETALSKETSRNESITAVVSRPGYNDDTASRAVARSDSSRDGPARSLHEPNPGHPA